MTVYTDIVRPGEGFMVHGAAVDLWLCRQSEVVLSGPAETGKTIAALHKLHLMGKKYKNAHLAMVRKTRKSMDASVIKSFKGKVLEHNSPVTPYGGEKPEWFDYPNGSRIVVGGMDNPDKMLSSEYDAIYINQAEELSLDDWEKLTTRVTGRAGNMPYAQVFADCNPGPPTHWILSRAREKALTLLHSQHKDNPTLFDPDTGEITEQGKRTMEVLDNLTGVRRKRLRDGVWAQVEGVVYDNFNEAVHVIDRFEIPEDWTRWRVIDFGYTNPFVCQWWAIDNDGRMFMYREIYMSGRLVEDHARDINQLSEGEYIAGTIADHDAEDRATLERYGVYTSTAKKSITPGLQSVSQRLRKAGDGRPRMYFLRDSLVEIDTTLEAQHYPTCTVEEFPVYAWPDGKEGKPVKELPIDLHNHGMDTTRYMSMEFETDGNIFLW